MWGVVISPGVAGGHAAAHDAYAAYDTDRFVEIDSVTTNSR